MTNENQNDQAFLISNRRADSHIELRDQINARADDEFEDIDSSKRELLVDDGGGANRSAIKSKMLQQSQVIRVSEVGSSAKNIDAASSVCVSQK